jgi:hypothetical protein
MSSFSGQKAHETERLARELALSVLRAPSRDSGSTTLQSGAGDPAAWEQRKILPPYLGELGVEIRYFLAAVEPWLRNGWRIPARRAELYPPGTAFADPELFADLGALLDAAGAKPMGTSFVIPGVDLTGFEVIAEYDAVSGLKVQAACRDPALIGPALRIAQLEQALRRCFARHHMLASRPVTPWDRTLTSVFDARSEHLCGGAIVLAPHWQPEAFTVPRYAAHPHVGMQLRQVRHNPVRNSDAGRVLAAARAAASHLDLPLLVYGEPGGTVRPEGLPSTYARGGGDLLAYELAMLRECRVMFAPDSGWCDLMCWLRVPTVLTRVARPTTHSCMQVFRPRLMLLDEVRPIGPQLDRLLAAEEMLLPACSGTDAMDDLDWDGPVVGIMAQQFINL